MAEIAEIAEMAEIAEIAEMAEKAEKPEKKKIQSINMTTLGSFGQMGGGNVKGEEQVQPNAMVENMDDAEDMYNEAFNEGDVNTGKNKNNDTLLPEESDDIIVGDSFQQSPGGY